MHIDYQALSSSVLYLVTFLIILSESGVFFLFFLPGDSLLFAVGLLANQGIVRIWYVIPLLIVAAVLGNFLGYFLGTFARGGLEQGRYMPKVKPEHLHRAERFYRRHGALALLFARFIPILRTLVPFFAGVVTMKRRVFTVWSLAGGAAWITAITLLGYYFGRQFNLQNVAFLGTGVIIAAIVATPLFIAIIKRLVR